MSCSACGWPPSCAPGCSACSTCSTSRRRACIRPTPSRCSTCWTGYGGQATRCSSSSTTWTWCGVPTGSSTSAPARANSAARCSTAGRSPGLRDVAESVTRGYLFEETRTATSAPRAQPTGTLAAARHQLSQPARPRRRLPARVCTPRSPVSPARASRRWSTRCSATWSRVTLGGEATTEPDAEDEQTPSSSTSTATPASGSRPTASKSIDRLVARRPEADRPDPALDAGHVHRAVRRGAAGVRRDAGGPQARLDRGPVLVQRRRGTVSRRVRARASSPSNCSSCQALTARARRATAPGTTRRR